MCFLVLACGRPADAFAQNCASLASELARVERQQAASDFSGAAVKQRIELERARSQKARCEASGASQCSSYATLVASMEANLASLERRARQSGAGNGLAARRASLIRQQRALSCGREAPVRQAAAPNLAGIGLLAWFGQSPTARSVEEPLQQAPPPAQKQPERPAPAKPRHDASESEERRQAFRPTRWGGGAYRTLCVRSCDGYFWPVSFQTSSSQFAKDDEACHSACPGSEVELYVHRNPGGGSDDAVNLAGKPYTELKTAYRFRKEFDRACTCKAARPQLPPANDEEAPPVAPQPSAAAQEQPARVLGLRGTAEPSAAD